MPFADPLPVSGPAVLGMAATALVMVLIPGPNMIYLASRSLSQGRRAGLISLAGTGLGFVCYLVLAAAGLAVVFVTLPWLFIGLKAAGVLYLGRLAWRSLRPGGPGLFEVHALPRDSAATLFRTGLVTNLLNPKSAVLYLTVIPQFIDPERGIPAVQGLVLGLVQIIVSLTVNAGVVVTAGAIARILARRPAWVRWQRRATGLLLVCVTVLLTLEVPAAARV